MVFSLRVSTRCKKEPPVPGKYNIIDFNMKSPI
jgi:hypothetical protein